MTGLELAPIVFGLTSAACWGAGDFCGGLATKRTQVYRVIISSQLISLMLLLILALVLHEPLPAFDRLLLACAAGIVGAIGILALYRALAVGQMGVAAPVSAVVAASVPVIAGSFIEGPPSVAQLIGFGLALVAVWFISRTGGSAIQWRDLGLPIIAGLGFGMFYVMIGSAGQEAVWWPLVAARIGSLGALFGVTIVRRQPRLVEKQTLGLVVLIGVLEVGGNACYILARQAGRLDVAAVLASLYPAVTVWLAWFFLKERMYRLQSIGVLAALAAIVLISI
jgi:drug/metabolite transporter (DMT)-like permease